ncbi:MAG TPA: electron transfer flavoprotein subunit beta/FixA family protein [Gemmatimonadales bacterium]|nr:electron transfer flavoprotein subunit beta/FixA family protein [Gemmatimonadales bacterium]
MRIAVCIKRVPDTEMRFAIARDGKTIDTAGLKFDLSDFDGYAVEVALRLVERHPPGEVTVIGLGPETLQETIRKALSMGVDRGVHLAAPEVPFDGLAIAKALAAELLDKGYELILFGRVATDTGNGTVGPMTAELLGLPCVSAISYLEVADGRGTAHRELEGATETVGFPLPAVLTIDEGIARPRLPTLKGIMAAKKKPVESRPAALGEARLTVEKLELPPERAAGRIVGEGADAVPELVRLLREEAKVL